MADTIPTTESVFEAHLNRSLQGKVEEDITEAYHPEVVLLTSYGIFKGHEGVREATQLLNNQLPDAQFEYKNKMVNGEIAFLEWSCHSHAGQVLDGVDTFHIRDGKILVQTTHYTVTRKFFH